MLVATSNNSSAAIGSPHPKSGRKDKGTKKAEKKTILECWNGVGMEMYKKGKN